MEDIAIAVENHKRMRWDGRAGAYEVWYTTLSHLTSGAGFWIRYAIVAPRRTQARVEVWFTSFAPDLAAANVSVCQRYPLEQFGADRSRFALRFGPSLLEAGRMTGMLDAGGTPVTWDLVYEPVTEPLQMLPPALYRTGWLGTKVLVPHPFLMAGGKIDVGGHSFFLNSDPGEQGHVWGSRHAAEWTWFHASSFVEEGGEPVPGYATGIVAQPSLPGGIVLPPVAFGHIVWREHHLRITPASRWDERGTGAWRWSGRMADEDVAVTVRLPWSETVAAEYEDPSGKRRFCHHTCRGGCEVEFKAPRRPPRVFRAPSAAHLELGSRSRDPRAPRVVRVQT